MLNHVQQPGRPSAMNNSRLIQSEDPVVDALTLTPTDPEGGSGEAPGRQQGEAELPWATSPEAWTERHEGPSQPLPPSPGRPAQRKKSIEVCFY